MSIFLLTYAEAKIMEPKAIHICDGTEQENKLLLQTMQV